MSRERLGSSAFITDIDIGMSNGLTVPFALAAGLSGAVQSKVTGQPHVKGNYSQDKDGTEIIIMKLLYLVVSLLKPIHIFLILPDVYNF